MNRKTQQVKRTRQARAHKAVTHRSELAELRLRKDAVLADLIAEQVKPFIAAEIDRQLKVVFKALRELTDAKGIVPPNPGDKEIVTP